MLLESSEGRTSLASEYPNEPPPIPPRDLIDFHLRWQEFRPIAKRIFELEELDAAARDTLMWLIALADRVNSADVAEDGGDIA